MKCRILGVIVFIFMMVSFSIAQAQDNQIPEFFKGKIYYCDWMISTAIAWGPQQVRSSATAIINVEGSQMAPLLQLLDLTHLVQQTHNPGDARVVFDLYKTDGTVSTYYASMFRLYDNATSASRQIDEGFRRDLSKYFGTILSFPGDPAPQHPGYISDKRTAIKIAEAVLIPIYGEAMIRQEEPFHAGLIKDIWHVSGSLNCPGGTQGCLGGVADVEISKQDGKILNVIHGK